MVAAPFHPGAALSGAIDPRFAPGDDSVHVVVDMQRLFAEATAWRVPTIADILPNVVRLVRRRPARTILTRFITPSSAADAVGAWRPYYERWKSVTTGEMDPAMLRLVEPLPTFTPPARVSDKATYSAFESEDFRAALDRLSPGVLIVSGVETDVCVLGTVLGAVDRGLPVLVVGDAVTSSSAPGHGATLDAVLPRFEEQIAVADTDAVLGHWPKESGDGSR